MSPPTPAASPEVVVTDDLSAPPFGSRVVGAGFELGLFIAFALAVYVVEYFVEGPIGAFGPSNFWIAFFLMGAWNGWSWAGAQTPQGQMVGHYIATLEGAPASTLTIAGRQLSRFGVLYGIPVLAFDFNLWLGILIAAMAAAATWFTPGLRAPWDIAAGTRVVEGLGSSSSLDVSPVTSVADLQLDGRRLAESRRAKRLLLATGFFSVIASGLIVWSIFTEAAEFVFADDFSWGLLTGIGWFPRRGIFDLSTLFVGTLWITGIAMMVAAPVGLGVAFYLSEYASPTVRKWLKPMVETLASIPSVVVGLFAISFISPKVLSPLLGDIGIFSLLAAGIGVGVLTVPIVASISEDAMRAVPQELREASYGLGGRRVTTALRVVFPAALSGISAAFIVGISRAIGETMVVFIAAGGSGGAIFETDPTEPGQAITAAMASLGAGTDSVAGSGLAFQSLYFLGAVLFLLTLVLNVISDRIVRRFRQVY